VLGQAYFDTPVRTVFVGTLVGAAFSQVAIRGRCGGEDALLNLAGVLLPLVAFLPVPTPGTDGDPCPGQAARYVPAEFGA